MGAYNYIVFDAVCPACGVAGAFCAQTHVASSFNGDDRGRFCHRCFELNEPMFWWDRDHPDWSGWIARADCASQDGSLAIEDCHTDCEHCDSDFMALICFRDAVPVEQRMLRVFPSGVPARRFGSVGSRRGGFSPFSLLHQCGAFRDDFIILRASVLILLFVVGS